jgi:hypothetical protein
MIRVSLILEVDSLEAACHCTETGAEIALAYANTLAS